MALRYFVSQKKDKFVNLTSKIAIFSIAFGIAMLIVSCSVIRGFEETIMEKVLQDQGHIIIYGNGPFEAEKVLKQLPKELKCQQIVETNAILVKGFRIETALVRGIESKNYKSVITKKEETQGNLPKIKIGEKFAQYIRISHNDTLSLIIPVAAPQPIGMVAENVDFVVDDIVQFKLHDLNRYGVVLELKEAQKALGLGNKITKIICFAKTPKQAMMFLDQIKKDLPDNHVFSWQDLNMLFADIMKTQRNMVSVILIAIMFLAVIANMSSLILFVNTKKREISVLRVLGATKRSIISIFAKIGFIIAALSSLIGTVFGILLTCFLVDIRKGIEYICGAKLFDPNAYLLPAIPTVLNISDIALIVGISFIIAFLSALIPAYKSASINVLENL